MKKFYFALFLSVSSFSFLEAGEDLSSHDSQEKIISPIHIQEPWARATRGPNGAAFMILSSQNPEGDRLLEASSPICEEVELHAHVQEGDIMRMRPVDFIEVHQKTVLKPGGLHIMFMKLHHPLKAGEKIPLKLTFEKAGEKDIWVPVFQKGKPS